MEEYEAATDCVVPIASDQHMKQCPTHFDEGINQYGKDLSIYFIIQTDDDTFEYKEMRLEDFAKDPVMPKMKSVVMLGPPKIAKTQVGIMYSEMHCAKSNKATFIFWGSCDQGARRIEKVIFCAACVSFRGSTPR